MNPIFAMKVIMLSHPCLPSLALSGGSINPAIWCLYSNAFSTSCRDPSLARGCSHSVVNVFGPYLPFKKNPDSYNACSKNCLIELIFELLKPKLSNTFFIKHMVTWVKQLGHDTRVLVSADAILWWSPEVQTLQLCGARQRLHPGSTLSSLTTIAEPSLLAPLPRLLINGATVFKNRGALWHAFLIVHVPHCHFVAGIFNCYWF